MKPTDQTGSGNYLLVSEGQLSFELLLDGICERLHDTQTHFSLKRIQKLEDTLDSLERELDEILGDLKTAAPAGFSTAGLPELPEKVPGNTEERSATVPGKTGMPGEE
ncbi:MAG: hypothetical protein LBP60_08690 [Spirochaetaceae bacterium]|nr:hypothetical protein [Spirochaetaceae bacterium]